jgi:nucleoside-diphosphate-sugar epimerase
MYTTARTYTLQRKLMLLARAVAIATLIGLASNYLLLREQMVARSVTLLFGFTALAVLFLSRLTKSLAAEHFQIVPKHRLSVVSTDAPVLVVGGAGYIGSMLCRKLLEAGERVRVLDSLVYGDFAIAELKSNERFELQVGDCRHIQSVVAAVKGAKAIIHLAAIVGDPACEQDRSNALAINFAATRMLIEIAKGYGVGRFLFASSCSVYGATDVVVDEDSVAHPVSLYGETKVHSERALLEARSATFHPTVLRLATVFGNGYRPRFDLVVNLLTAKAAQDGVITIFNGSQWRPFIHVQDVARGFVAALNAPLQTVDGHIFNLGDSRLNYTLDHVAHEIQTVFPNVRVVRTENSDRRNYRVSFSKVRQQLGFQTSLGLTDGILELKAAFTTRAIADYGDIRYHNQRFLQDNGVLISSCKVDADIMAAFAGARSTPEGEFTLPAYSAG